MYGREAYFSDRDEVGQRELYSWPAESKAHFRVKLDFGYPRAQNSILLVPPWRKTFSVDYPMFCSFRAVSDCGDRS
jgi:hypothetical protein